MDFFFSKAVQHQTGTNGHCTTRSSSLSHLAATTSSAAMLGHALVIHGARMALQEHPMTARQMAPVLPRRQRPAPWPSCPA